MKRLALIGSTGSIGTQAIRVIEAHPRLYSVQVLAAGKNIVSLAKQIKKYSPRIAVIADESLLLKLKQLTGKTKTEIVGGDNALSCAAQHQSVDMALIAFSGIASLNPTLAAIHAHKDIALANKEVLVAAGSLIMPLISKNHIKLIPVDSEHSAVMQSLDPRLEKNIITYPTGSISRIILTASGGPFRHLNKKQLAKQTPAQALKHPNWSMGSKITIDSASLMNKGFEVIEAHYLFDMPYDQIEVVIHPQSIIHSMVEYTDHSCLAQMSYPDMTLPIQYAFSYPTRLPSKLKPLNFYALKKLTFEKPDTTRFPCLNLAYRAGNIGGTMTTILNAANERAVELFLQKEIAFTEIPKLIAAKMKKHNVKTKPSLKDILKADLEGRDF